MYMDPGSAININVAARAFLSPRAGSDLGSFPPDFMNLSYAVYHDIISSPLSANGRL